MVQTTKFSTDPFLPHENQLHFSHAVRTSTNKLIKKATIRYTEDLMNAVMSWGISSPMGLAVMRRLSLCADKPFIVWHLLSVRLHADWWNGWAFINRPFPAQFWIDAGRFRSNGVQSTYWCPEQVGQ